MSKRPRDIQKTLNEDSCLGVPEDLWERLNAEFAFTVDVCSSHENFKVEKHYTKEEDGLKQDWSGEIVWCHPLFDRDIKKWVAKAMSEARNCQVVMLLPSSTDTYWFSLLWDHENHKAREGVEIRFLPKRLRYKGGKNGAAFASVVIVIDRRNVP